METVESYRIQLDKNGITYERKAVGTPADPPHHATVEGSRASRSDKVRTASVHLIADINSRIKRPARATTAFGGYLAAILVMTSLIFVLKSSSFRLGDVAFVTASVIMSLAFAAVLVTGAAMTFAALRDDKVRRLTTLEYVLDRGATDEFARMREAVIGLGRSRSVWRVTPDGSHSAMKSGVAPVATVSRMRVTAGLGRPPCIQTNVDIPSISPLQPYGASSLFFLPDQILMFAGNQYVAVSYSLIQISSSLVSFHEDGAPPSDSKIVGQTWEHARKDGGADLRYTVNRRIAIAEYGCIDLSSQAALSLRLYVSSVPNAERFCHALREYVGHRHGPTTASSGRSSGHRQQADAETQLEPMGNSPYEVLGISHNATWDEIADAYRRMAQMNHPDKVAALDPELRRLADSRMKAINSAYGKIKQERGR